MLTEREAGHDPRNTAPKTLGGDFFKADPPVAQAVAAKWASTGKSAKEVLVKASRPKTPLEPIRPVWRSCIKPM